MKSKKMKQGMSWLLCMVMLLGNNVTVLAEEAETGKEGQTQTDAQKVSAQEMEDSQQETQTSEIQEMQETENTAEQTEAEPEEEPVYNEAVQLRHEFYDEAGNVISTVTADIQEGSFEADASAISMEADTLTAEEDAYMQGLIKENLPEDTYLGDYVLYDVVFKVNGELTDPKKEIKLTYEGTGIGVQDVQDAVVCQYNVADPEIPESQDSVTEIIQRNDMIRYMEENGEDTSLVDDHDLSEIVLNEYGTAEQISMEVRKSSIFGCYVEEQSQETTFSQEVNGTNITVAAPEGAFGLAADQVTMAAAALPEEQAAAVEEQLKAQAADQGLELKGYAAFDISLWADGEEIQPQKPVTVTVENTGLDAAAEINAFQIYDQDNSLGSIANADENGVIAVETGEVLPIAAAVFGEPEVLEEEKQEQESADGLTEETVQESVEEEIPEKTEEDTSDETDEKDQDDEKVKDEADTSIEEDTEKETDSTKSEKEDAEKEDTEKEEASKKAETVEKEDTDDKETKETTEEAVSEPLTLTEEKDGVTVILTAPEGAFPVASDQVSMTVEDLTQEQRAAIEEQLQAQAEENGQELKGYVAYDIRLWANGEEIQPQVLVSVTFENAGLDVEDAETTEGFQLDEETETLNNIEGSVTEDGNAVVEAEHFTPTGVGSFGTAEETTASYSTTLLQAETKSASIAGSLPTTGESEEQIVHEKYVPEPTDEYPYFVGDNTDVRIQKNVAPTDKENEFYIYLNVEPQLSWEEILEMTGLWIINSANVGDFVNSAGIDASTNASTVQSIMHQNGLSNTHVSRIGDQAIFKDHSWYTSNNYKEQGPIDIEYTVKKTDGSEEIYTIKNQYYSLPSNSEQVTILVRLPFQQYYSKISASWNTISGKRTLVVEIQEDKLFEGTGEFVLRDDKVNLESVTDPMGNYITYKNELKASNDSEASYNPKNLSITWEFPESKDLPIDFQDYEVVTLPDGNQTVYWKNAYEMIYRIKLETTKDGFVFGNVYDTNKTTALTYNIKDTKGETVEKAVDFKLPAVKAKIKEFIFQKVTQENEPLQGAEFTLYAEDDKYFSEALATAVSDEEGKVVFDADLQPGTYIMKETVIPENYVQADTIWKYIVKNDGTTELRDESGNLISVTAGNEYPQIQNYNINGHLKADKTAEVLDWDNRTYKIELYASHDLSVEWPKDIVLALDVSGSMAWTLAAPSSETKKVKDISVSNKNVIADQKLKGQDATVSNYKQFHYYVKDGLDYKPIIYRPVEDTNGHPENAGWYYVGASSSQQVGYDGKIPDQENTIVYVLDRQDQRSVQIKIEALQEAVTAFVENVKNISPESTIGIVTFSGILQEEISLTDADSLYNQIEKIFDEKIKLRGGTQQNLGLDAAYEMLDESSENQNKAVVLFTDGAPNGVSTNAINASAEKVKEIADLFTVGLYDSETAAGQLTNMQEWASKPSDKYCFITSDTESLMKEFADMFASMNIAVTGAVMRDYIDSRFVVTDSEGTILETGASIGDGGILRYDSSTGLQYVEWTNQTISYSKDGKTAWNQTIYVKANPEYIGGNDVTTNAGPGYSVTVNGTSEGKESPEVNVKIDFNIGNAEDTIFLGESLENYFTEAKRNTVTDIQPTTGADAYTMWDDVNTQIEWFQDAACTQAIDVGDIIQSKPESDTVYYAKVTVTPKTSGQAGLDNTANHCNDTNGISKTGTYTVYVVSGSIVIEKTVDKIPDDLQGSLSFEFTLTNTKDNSQKTYNVTFQEDDISNKEASFTISNLPQGIYTLGETDPGEYSAGGISLSGVGTNPAVIIGQEIYIGFKDDESTTDLSRRDAKAEVLNKYVEKSISLEVTKEITNYKDSLVNDEFIISLVNADEESYAYNFVLKHSETGSLVLENPATFIVKEILPMEYNKTAPIIEIQKLDENEAITSTTTIGNGESFQAQAGDRIRVVVKNTFEHVNYFHDKDSENNDFPPLTPVPRRRDYQEQDILKEDPFENLEGGEEIHEIL